jgi:OOP family OmpA-OmpF porin
LAPDPIAAPQKDPAPPVSRCDFSKVLPSDELFENRGYVLTDDAAVLLARDVMIPIASCASLELITVTGYTDHLGPLQSRQTLVEHRAEAIKAFLVAHGIASARVNAVGQADAPPISTGCAAQHHHKLVECLAPDRRIVVQVQGIAR